MDRSRGIIDIFPTGEDLARAAADRFVLLAGEAVRKHGVFTVALSGGTTPAALYTLLATDPTFRDLIPWPGTHFFFGDERTVPPDNPESNYRMANEAMFMHLPAPGASIHRIQAGGADPSRAAAEYEDEIASFFREHHLTAGGLPRFDLIFLGMGPDGHTASLFPDTAALQEKKRLVVSNPVEQIDTIRITMTLPLLNNGAEVILLVTGDRKAAMVGEVMANRGRGPRYPVELVKPVDGIKRWMLDAAAAASLAG